MLLSRVLAVWCLLAVLMTANGVAREVALKRLVSAPAADAISAAAGVAIILTATYAGLRPLAGQPARTLAWCSALFVGLTVGFELVVGRYVDHRTWAELAGNYALWRGRLWPLVLLVLALTPFLWGRWAGAARGPAGS